MSEKVYKYFDIEIHGDARLSANVRICMECEGKLEMDHAHGWLFGFCKKCSKLYVLEEGRGE
ncbi:MAG: hypothetical protein GY937_19970 [bacterium]|nr:hypothetical protein [bacterium]